MAVKEFAMPDLGEGLTESELVSWNIEVGDTVELNQVIAEVETAKALVQLPSPFAGTVSKLFVEPGTTVLVGSPIIAIEVDGEAPVPEADTVGAESSAVDEPKESGRNSVLVGYGPPVEGTGRPTRRARGGASLPAPTEQPPLPEPVEGRPAPAERPRSTPPVRKLAADRGIDLSTVTGTGEGGLITREDVLAHADAPAASASPAASRDRASRERETR